MAENLNRRRFFNNLVKITGAAVIAPAVLNSVFTSEAFAQKKRGAPAAAGGGAGAAAMPLITPADPVAKAVQYVEDHKKAPKAGTNHCGNCGFYTKKETRDGKEVGGCTIFAGKVVLANAWCASWNPKA